MEEGSSKMPFSPLFNLAMAALKLIEFFEYFY